MSPASPLPGFPAWLPPFALAPLFTAAECDRIILQAEASGKFKAAQVMMQDGQVGVEETHCLASMAAFWPGSELHTFVKERLAERVQLINQHYRFALFEPFDNRFIPNVGVLRYDGVNKSKFDPHVDVGGQHGVEYRKLSVVVPLNAASEYEGGRLIIDTGEKFDAMVHHQIGDAVIFPSFAMHGVTPVTAGKRYSLVTFLQGPHFQ